MVITVRVNFTRSSTEKTSKTSTHQTVILDKKNANALSCTKTTT